MTVATSVNRAQFLGSGSAGPFTFNMRFFANSEIAVIHVDAADVETVLTEGIGYTLTGAGSLVGGMVTLATALATGEALTVVRTLDLLQLVSLRNQGAFFPEIHEDSFDRFVMMMQQISEQADRAIKMPSAVSGDFTLPSGSRDGKVIGFDTQGAPVMVPLGGEGVTMHLLGNETAYGVKSFEDVEVRGPADLAAAVAAAGTNRKTIIFSVDQNLVGNIVIPANVELLPLNGAKINHGAYTISYAGSTARWPLAQIFNGSGAVKLSGATDIYAQWFGAKGDGITDNTGAFQSWINCGIASLTSVCDSSNGGHALLRLPRGMYLISGTLNVSGVIGLRMVGAGDRTTQIVFTGSAGNLFYCVASIYCQFEQITFSTGTVSFSGGLPQVTTPAIKDSTCFRFNGTGGGTEYLFKNCTFMYWNKVFTTLEASSNDDTHRHYNCAFLRNKTIWDNTNIQAVEWVFQDCKAFYTETAIFNNPGGSLQVRGGDFINPGNFLVASLASTGLDSTFTDIRFENYQNIDPTSAPKLLVLSGTHTGLSFERCSARGGGTLDGKTSATISGLFGIRMKDCAALSGTWEITADGVNNSVGSLLTLDNTALTIHQTTVSGAGYRPISINYINYPNSINGRINRYFLGATGGQTLPAVGVPIVDKVTFQATVSASTATRSIPVFVPDPYKMVLSGVKFVVNNNTVNTFDLIVWQDSTKTVKLCEALALNANGITKVVTATPTTFPVLTSTSNPIYVEVTSTANAGTINGQLSFTYEQSY